MFEALAAAAIVTLCSMLGSLFFGSKGRLVGTHKYVLPVAVGVFLGVVFFELVPEAIEMSPEGAPLAILGGFFAFYLLSHFLHTYHHHHRDAGDGCTSGQGARLLLIGDAVHNVADGVVIAAAFLVNPAIGVATTVGVALHEIPQEIAEFGVLIKSGYSRRKALYLNLLSASSILLGVLATWFISDHLYEYLWLLVGIVAGNLLYIATSDLIPELRQSHRDHFLQTFIATLVGVALMFFILEYTHELIEDEHADEALSAVAETH